MDLFYSASNDEAIPLSNEADLTRVLQESSASTLHIVAQVMPWCNRLDYQKRDESHSHTCEYKCNVAHMSAAIHHTPSKRVRGQELRLCSVVGVQCLLCVLHCRRSCAKITAGMRVRLYKSLRVG